MTTAIPTKTLVQYLIGYQPHVDATIYYLNIVPGEDFFMDRQFVRTFTDDLDYMTPLAIYREDRLEDVIKEKDDLELMQENCGELLHLFPDMTEDNLQYIKENMHVFKTISTVNTVVSLEV